METLVRSLYKDRDYDLELSLIASKEGLTRIINQSRIQKPGLALAGYPQSVRPAQVQVLGKTELAYLKQLDRENQKRAITRLMSTELACVVITANQEVPLYLKEAAERHSKSLFRSRLPSSAFIGQIHTFLDKHLGQETSVHGVLVGVFGMGVLLTGPSGIGKSECALDLILRGHRLVADDMVIIRQVNHYLVGRCSPITRHHMEVRGLGILNAKELFGATAVRDNKKIELIIELKDWDASSNDNRTGREERTQTLLEIHIPRILLPLRPGRNVASIVEVAARNELLKLQGQNSLIDFEHKVEKHLSLEPPRDK